MASEKQKKEKRVEKRAKEDLLYKYHGKAYKPIRTQDYLDENGGIDGNKMIEAIRERKNNRRYIKKIGADSGNPHLPLVVEAHDLHQEAMRRSAHLHGNKVTIGKGGSEFRTVGEALNDYRARNKKSFLDNLATRVTGSSADLLEKRTGEEKDYADKRNQLREAISKHDKNYKDYTGKSGTALFDAAFSDYMTRRMTEAAEKRSTIGNLAKGSLPGGRIEGVNYDSFGQPIRPRIRSYNGMSDRRRERLMEEDAKARDAYAAAMQIWTRDNPRIARSGVSAAQWYRSEFAGSEEYKTIKAQTRLNNAAAAAERDRMNKIASQIEGARELERNGYTFTDGKWSAPKPNTKDSVPAPINVPDSNSNENEDPMNQRAGYSGGEG